MESKRKRSSATVESPKVVVCRLKDDGTELIECASFYLNSDHCFKASSYYDYAILKISKSGISLYLIIRFHTFTSSPEMQNF